MTRIAIVSGGLGSPSSTRVLGDDIASRLASLVEEADVEVIELRDIAHGIVDAMLTGFPTGETARAVEAVTSADALVAVSPTFSASMSGLFKSFFDILEADALRGKPVLLAATGGSERHSLMLEFAMRPLFSYLGATPVRTGVFAATSDFGGEGAASLERRVHAAAAELAGALEGARPQGRSDGFVDFATLLSES